MCIYIMGASSPSVKTLKKQHLQYPQRARLHPTFTHAGEHKVKYPQNIFRSPSITGFKCDLGGPFREGIVGIKSAYAWAVNLKEQIEVLLIRSELSIHSVINSNDARNTFTLRLEEVLLQIGIAGML